MITLYIKENKTIGEVAKVLSIAESTVFDRMKRLNIPSSPERKIRYLNKKTDILKLPDFSEKLAEFFGVMLGDGHINFYPNCATYQIYISINNTTDKDYIPYVKDLVESLFKLPAGIHYRKNPDMAELFVSSVDLLKYLRDKGLSSTNKVKAQVKIPEWIFSKETFQRAFLKGFFDTARKPDLYRYAREIGFGNPKHIERAKRFGVI